MTILTAISGDDDVDKLIQIGLEISEGLDLQLAVVHVASADDFESYREEMENVPGMSEYSIEQREDNATRTAERLVDTAVPKDSIPEDILYLGKVGEPTDEVLVAAEETDARYLVIGGRKRSPTGKAVFGSVSQSILLNAEIPTISIMGK